MSDTDFGGDLGIGAIDDSAFTDNSVFTTGAAPFDETALAGNSIFSTNYNANAVPPAESISDSVSADTTANNQTATDDTAAPAVNQMSSLSSAIEGGMMNAPALTGQAATSFANYVQGGNASPAPMPNGQQQQPNQPPAAAQQWAVRPLTTNDLGPNPNASAGSVQQMGVNGGSAINPQNSALYTPPAPDSGFNTPNPTIPGAQLPYPGRANGSPSNLPALDFTHRIMSTAMQNYGLSADASAELAAISQKTGIGMSDVTNMSPKQILDHLVTNGASQGTIQEVNKLATQKGNPLPIQTQGPARTGTLFPSATAPTGLTAPPTTAHPQPQQSAPQVAQTAPSAPPAVSRWAQPQPAGSVAQQFQALGATPGEMETIHIESGFQRGQSNGRNVGLGQFSPDLLRKYGITNPDDPAQVLRGLRAERGEFEQRMGRKITDGEFYMMHQQGQAGGPALLRAAKANPTGTAWQTVRPFYKSDTVAKQAIWGNIPDSVKASYGTVNNVSNAQFASLWTNRFGVDAAPNNGTMVASAAPAAAPSLGTRIANAFSGRANQAPNAPAAPAVTPQTQFAQNMQKLFGPGGYGAITQPAPNYRGAVGPAMPVKIAGGHRYAVDQSGRLITTDTPTA